MVADAYFNSTLRCIVISNGLRSLPEILSDLDS